MKKIGIGFFAVLTMGLSPLCADGYSESDEQLFHSEESFVHSDQKLELTNAPLVVEAMSKKNSTDQKQGMLAGKDVFPGDGGEDEGVLPETELDEDGNPKTKNSSQPDSDTALQMLLEGNERFVKGQVHHLSYLAEAKDKMLESQSPFAAIIGCSDSRVPPELIFDRGLGELFVVRDAGNVIGPIEMDSVEFAAASLNVPLIVVLGHQNCGAVKATLAGQGSAPELDNIAPLIENALKSCDTVGANRLTNAIRCNVKNGVMILRNSPTIQPLIQQKKVQIVGAYYEIATGKVSIIER